MLSWRSEGSDRAVRTVSGICLSYLLPSNVQCCCLLSQQPNSPTIASAIQLLARSVHATTFQFSAAVRSAQCVCGISLSTSSCPSSPLPLFGPLIARPTCTCTETADTFPHPILHLTRLTPTVMQPSGSSVLDDVDAILNESTDSFDAGSYFSSASADPATAAASSTDDGSDPFASYFGGTDGGDGQVAGDSFTSFLPAAAPSVVNHASLHPSYAR